MREVGISDHRRAVEASSRVLDLESAEKAEGLDENGGDREQQKRVMYTIKKCLRSDDKIVASGEFAVH